MAFERKPLVPSIHTYSAIHEPFWSSCMYFMSCNESATSSANGKTRFQRLTFEVFETVVDSAFVILSVIGRLPEKHSSTDHDRGVCRLLLGEGVGRRVCRVQLRIGKVDEIDFRRVTDG